MAYYSLLHWLPLELLNRRAKDVVQKLCGRSGIVLVSIVCCYTLVLQDWAEDFGLGLGSSYNLFNIKNDMNTFEIRKEDIGFLKIDAGIRIRDFGGFFDADGRKLRALLDVASNCEVGVLHIGTKPDVVITLTNSEARQYLGRSSAERHSYEPFYREVIRVGLLLEKLALLIDPAARIAVDYPTEEELVGRSVSHYEEFLRKFPLENKEEGLSTVVPQELEGRIDDFLNLVIPQQNYMLGTCHWIWDMKKVILRYAFNINWQTPAEKNPHVIYD